MKSKENLKFAFYYWRYRMFYRWFKKQAAKFEKPGADQMRGYWPFNEFDLVEKRGQRFTFYCGTGTSRTVYLCNKGQCYAEIRCVNKHERYEPILKAQKCAHADRCIAIRKRKNILFKLQDLIDFKERCQRRQNRLLGQVLANMVETHHAKLKLLMARYESEVARKKMFQRTDAVTTSTKKATEE